MNIALGRFDGKFTPWSPPDGRVFETRFACDTETTEINEGRPDLTPALVIATAFGDGHGVFLTPATVGPFLRAHQGVQVVFHNAAFDLKVLQAALGPAHDVYEAIEAGRVWDTLVLRRLFALATEGHAARGTSGLDACAAAFLDLRLDKDVRDSGGRLVRTGFGQFLGRPLADFPDEYLRYAAL